MLISSSLLVGDFNYLLGCLQLLNKKFACFYERESEARFTRQVAELTDKKPHFVNVYMSRLSWGVAHSLCLELTGYY